MTAPRHDSKFPRRSILRAAAAVAAFSLPFATCGAAAQKPRLGLVGSGNVGSNLGRVWANAGYEVMFSSTNLEADRKLAAEIGKGARAGTPQEAAAFGDVLVVAVPYSALPDVGMTLGSALRGKVVIDACNPWLARDGALAEEAHKEGAGVVSSRLLPGARIVRAFNMVGAAHLGTAHETPGKIGMPMAGDDAEAVEIAMRLVRDIGLEPVLLGGLAMARHLMPGSPLAGEHSPEEVRRIAATLTP